MLKRLSGLLKGGNINKVTVKDAHDGKIIAEGDTPYGVFSFEGHWYFDEDNVEMSRLTITTRTYTCPYKGDCYWIDLNSPKNTVKNIGWVYREPKRGYQHIKDKIAFYKGSQRGTIAEAE